MAVSVCHSLGWSVYQTTTIPLISVTALPGMSVRWPVQFWVPYFPWLDGIRGLCPCMLVPSSFCSLHCLFMYSKSAWFCAFHRCNWWVFRPGTWAVLGPSSLPRWLVGSWLRRQLCKCFLLTVIRRCTFVMVFLDSTETHRNPQAWLVLIVDQHFLLRRVDNRVLHHIDKELLSWLFKCFDADSWNWFDIDASFNVQITVDLAIEFFVLLYSHRLGALWSWHLVPNQFVVLSGQL